MEIIIWGINYHPEPTGIGPYTTEMARFLAERGHTVRVVTTFSYYPQWEKAPADRGRWARRDLDGAVEVYRGWHYVPKQVSTLKRILHELSFGFTSAWRALRLPAPAIYVVVSPPLGLGFFAWIVSRLKGRPFLFHVQDLQPDAAVGLGMLQPGLVIRVLYALEALAYRKAAAVSGISDGMLAAYTRKGVPAERQIYFPNWLRTTAPAVQRGRFRVKFGVPAEALLAVYSGNVGRKQRIEILLEAAELLAAGGPTARPVSLIIAGAGAGYAELASRLAAKPLPGLTLLPLLDEADYAAMLGEADLGLVTQAAGTGQFFFPSKLLSLLQAGLPVLTVADAGSELADAVAAGRFGVNVTPEDAAGLAQALRGLAAAPEEVRALAAGTRWVERFAPERVLPEFERGLARLAGKPMISVPPVAPSADPAN